MKFRYKINKQLYKLMNFLGFKREFLSDTEYTIYNLSWLEIVHQHHNFWWGEVNTAYSSIYWETFESWRWMRVGGYLILDLTRSPVIMLNLDLFLINISIDIGKNNCYPFKKYMNI
jgi:hypothetical protein